MPVSNDNDHEQPILYPPASAGRSPRSLTVDTRRERGEIAKWTATTNRPSTGGTYRGAVVVFWYHTRNTLTCAGSGK